MDQLMPTLNAALNKIAKTRPGNPAAALAEILVGAGNAGGVQSAEPAEFDAAAYKKQVRPEALSEPSASPRDFCHT